MTTVSTYYHASYDLLILSIERLNENLTILFTALSAYLYLNFAPIESNVKTNLLYPFSLMALYFIICFIRNEKRVQQLSSI